MLKPLLMCYGPFPLTPITQVGRIKCIPSVAKNIPNFLRHNVSYASWSQMVAPNYTNFLCLTSTMEHFRPGVAQGDFSL